MKEPVLVDTSVWIDFFKGSDTPQVNILTEYIENDETIYLCPTIIQEILQGITNDNQCKKYDCFMKKPDNPSQLSEVYNFRFSKQ